MGQEWVTALEPDYRRHGVGWVRLGVFCNTDRFQYPTERKPGHCKRFGGDVSWERCTRCPLHVRVGAAGYASDPLTPQPELCKTGDLRFDGSRSKCRACYQKMKCLSHRLRSHGAKRVRLVVLR